MKILYFNPSVTPEAEARKISEGCHDLVFAEMHAEALRLIRNQSFDAVVIENKEEDIELDFTLEVYGLRPTLPVFLTNDWGRDLSMGLDGVATGAFAGA
jgi:hypothetical protein